MGKGRSEEPSNMILFAPFTRTGATSQDWRRSFWGAMITMPALLPGQRVIEAE